MSETVDVQSLSKEEFLNGMIDFFKSVQIDRYRLESDRERYLPDMFTKDAIQLETCTCDFITKGLNPNQPDEESVLTMTFDLRGDPKDYIQGYETDDIALKPLAESILSIYQQNSKKPFQTLRMLFSMLNMAMKK
ncbi:hypothetical protein [Halomonas sp. MM17-34]|uniref:hypothetical protein n=1 Tax=Halomonas sp. MM17-34 TaxID=2917742 RepID=UPI001EF5D8BA|nr:hypothetical protein [Halomonas sp. MM17-34]MCG7605686.1 hypothetical protein [Halomonas sp. MM17-34]